MNPQLEKQYGDADEALTFALARQGLLGQNSSVRAKEQSDLLEKMRIQKRTVIDKAKDVANSQRQAVSGLESNLIAMAQASANPATAASQAGMQAKALTTPPSFSPLEMVFTDATSALATQAELERRKQAAFDMGISNIVGGGSSQTITA